MYPKDPFVIGPALELTDEQKRAVALDKEWREAGKTQRAATTVAEPRSAEEVRTMTDPEFNKEWQRLGARR